VLDTAGSFNLADRWDFTAIGTANQVELLRADTTNDVLNLRNVSINATTSAYANNFITNLIYTGGGGVQASSVQATVEYRGAGGLGTDVVAGMFSALASS